MCSRVILYLAICFFYPRFKILSRVEVLTLIETILFFYRVDVSMYVVCNGLELKTEGDEI